MKTNEAGPANNNQKYDCRMRNMAIPCFLDARLPRCCDAELYRA